MNKRGFSIVELIVVITIIAILLALAVVSFRNYQADARNEQRRIRAENISRYLETVYNTGSSNPPIKQGEYPSGSAIADYIDAATPVLSTTKLEQLFSRNGFDLSNLRSAGKDSYGLVPSTNYYDGAPTVDTMNPDDYVYQPLRYELGDGQPSPCTGGAVGDDSTCRSFNLYYMTEGDNQVHKISSIH